MKKCSVCGSNNGKVLTFKGEDYYCWKHYAHMRLHGRILNRTKYTPNEIIEYPEHAEIVLYTSDGIERGRALVDISDLSLVRGRKWYMRTSGDSGRAYVYTAGEGHHKVSLHTLILGAIDGYVVDHRDGDGLNNRRSNLRHLTLNANLLNRRRMLPKSGRIGVKWRADRNRWVASIITKGRYTQKHFFTFSEACAWREVMEKQYVGITASELGN